MKNKLLKLIFRFSTLLAVCTLFASFSPSLDGRAVVADEGQFPEGFFAKTVGYLPGDVLSITNISGKTSVDILVIGALDPSEGVAVMLSPEAAKALGITKNSNIIVKITKRTGQDERSFGTAVIAKASDSDWNESESSEETALESEPEIPEQEEIIAGESEETIAGESEETIVEENIPVEESAVTAEEEQVSETETMPEEEKNDTESEFEEFVDDTEFAEEEFIESDVSPEESETADESVPSEEYTDEGLSELSEETEENAEETFDEFDEFEEESIPEEEYSEEELSELKEENSEIDEELPEQESEEEFIESENIEEEFIESEYSEEEFSEESIPEETDAEEETASDFDSDALEEENVDFDVASESEEAAETEEITAPLEEEILEKEVFEEVIPLEIEDSDGDTVAEPEESLETEEEYDAIVLVPAEDFPPVVDEPEVSVLPVEEIIPLEEMAEEKNADVVPEKINETVSEFVPEKEVKAENIISTSEDFSEYTVGSLSDLKSGAYYIQIAVYKDSANISEIISKYGSHYPITLVPLKSGSAKQILIGPLSVDEYGTVLARFKANGFKDAFLRKIK